MKFSPERWFAEWVRSKRKEFQDMKDAGLIQDFKMTPDHKNMSIDVYFVPVEPIEYITFDTRQPWPEIPPKEGTDE